jgi:dihydrofolate reductase
MFLQPMQILMGKLIVFNFISLNGFYKGTDADISWNRHGEEENAFGASSMGPDGGTLLFGRITYEMMASYWPTPMALQQNPLVAAGMNQAEKIVFSRTLQKTEWNNTRLVNDNMVEEVIKLKQLPGKDMALLGSGSILTQLAEHGLVDEFLFMVNPVALGDGTPIFHNISQKLELKLTSTRTFKSGVVLLSYQPRGN